MPTTPLSPDAIAESGCNPGIENWPKSYRLLERVQTASRCEIAFAYSLKYDAFAIIPIFGGRADAAPIFIEKRFDNDALSRKISGFADGNLMPLSRARVAQLGAVAIPDSFVVLETARTSAIMRIAFAYSARLNGAFAILRFVPRTKLRPILFEEPCDNRVVQQALHRFANGSYPQLVVWADDYNRGAFGPRTLRRNARAWIQRRTPEGQTPDAS